MSFYQHGLFYSTSTGKTEEVADLIQEKIGSAAPQDIADVDVSSLASYDGLIVGAPTWNTGADSERSGTSWDDVLGNIAGLDLKGKPVAVFGLGDSIGYGEYFCDAMEELYSSFKASGAKMVGHWPADGYQHEDSKALLGDGSFCGLPLDQDNEDDKTEERIEGWVAQLKNEGF
ncbi:flavodoxin IsiB [Coccomyxa subellipsoidea C-169]|uniref:Flavodoxin IsiB n=1 Tax=Coccomyxa subellipsoidea (strain C-169) TaxID=574566 RepID=I0YX63_COCSC|nr:flavodoxin IsiB [Coccomyxa subellipsoidea C-169]EIE22982.1 flavodoxin IsiB [Coccomyxa subellipsoidea C-169]|eukprot:XP_005647526.1 flavodoxin IsiB [Coccomyxa subellipsoidea C-169]